MLTELKRLTCVCCGGQLEEKDGKLVCKYCKNTFTEVEKISEEEVVALNRATTDRNLLRFDEALEEYNLLLKKYPENEMANWGALLCDYGIIYEEDYNGEYIPTCHRLNERPIKQSPYHAKLNAEHAIQAEKIEKLRLSIMDKAKKIPPYDVFICYKATEEKRGVNVPTRESKWARDIYEKLTNTYKLRVFFAEKSLVGSNIEYEPHIYAALRSAKLMFVLAGSIEHVNATWVANEWKRYAKYVHDGEEKTLRVIYDGIEPYDLPKELQKAQAIDLNSDWMGAVLKAAEAIFQKQDETPEWQKAMDEMRAKMNAGAGNDAVIADKYCAKCYAPQAKHVRFCGECASKEFIVAPDGVKYCAECGTGNQIKQIFCVNCGKTQFFYTKEEYQAEVERREQARIAEEERKERERIAAEERRKREEEKAKKTKAFLKIFLPIVAIVIAIIIAITAIDCNARDGLGMELSADGSYYIVTDCPQDKTEAVIPDIYKGKPVKEIGKYAFDSCTSLTSVVIPDSVTSIGNSAFAYCNSLTSITIPDSVTSIDDYAFSSCDSLMSVTCSANVCASLPKNVKTVIITSGDSISDYEFYDCNSLTSITIPDSVTSIGGRAFYGCTSLTSVTIGKNIASIGSYAFYGCDSVTNITCPAIALSSISKSKLQTVIITSGAIGERSFYGCAELTSVTIGNGVTSIGEYAFNNCSGLTSIDIPDSVTHIGDSAFAGCDSVTSITIPDGVTNIGGWAFYNCGSLTSIVISNGVTSIGNGVFYNCDSLTSIIIPNGVTSIGNSAFFNCKKLTSLKFNGSKAQWNTIEKGTNWKNNVPATEVVCTDGSVTI